MENRLNAILEEYDLEFYEVFETGLVANRKFFFDPEKGLIDNDSGKQDWETLGKLLFYDCSIYSTIKKTPLMQILDLEYNEVFGIKNIITNTLDAKDGSMVKYVFKKDKCLHTLSKFVYDPSSIICGLASGELIIVRLS